MYNRSKRNWQINQLAMGSAIGALAGVVLGIAMDIAISGDAGTIFPGAVTIVGIIIGGIIGFIRVVNDSAHSAKNLSSTDEQV